MRNSHYNVKPRYSCGSPAAVDEATALRVARAEKEAHDHALAGRYGDDERHRAEREGLIGIVEHVIEGKRCWHVTCLITGKVYDRPFNREESTTEAQFAKDYDALVKALRKLRDKHGMNPDRIALQACQTLANEGK